MSEKHIGLIKVAVKRLMGMQRVANALEKNRLEISDLWSMAYLVLQKSRHCYKKKKHRCSFQTFLVNQMVMEVGYQVRTEDRIDSRHPDYRVDRPDFAAIKLKVMQWFSHVGFEPRDAEICWLILGEEMPAIWVQRRMKVSRGVRRKVIEEAKRILRIQRRILREQKRLENQMKIGQKP